MDITENINNNNNKSSSNHGMYTLFFFLYLLQFYFYLLVYDKKVSKIFSDEYLGAYINLLKRKSSSEQ